MGGYGNMSILADYYDLMHIPPSSHSGRQIHQPKVDEADLVDYLAIDHNWQDIALLL